MLHDLHVPVEAAGQRLDVWLETCLEGCSRSLVALCIKEGRCTVVPGKAKPGFRLHGVEQVSIEVPEIEPIEIVPENIPLTILYEDDELLIIDKAPGMVVHPAIGHPRATVINAVLGHVAMREGDPLRPGLIHRLDADTSGVLAVAKTPQALAWYQAAFKERRVAKRYLAWIHGEPKSDLIEHRGWLGRHPRDFRKRCVLPASHPQAKEAYTTAVVRERHGHYSVLEVSLHTGRTHQIRVHLADRGHPILADGVYGRSASWPLNDPQLHRQALHAWQLSLPRPDGSMLQLEAAVPEALRALLQDHALKPL